MSIRFHIYVGITFFYIYRCFSQLHEHRAAMEFQQAGIDTKPGEYQQFIEQLQCYKPGEYQQFLEQQQQQPNSVLQLATLPSEIDPTYNLQLAQPNLQNDPTAQND